MKVLWLCNIMLPSIAEALGREASNKEGWLTGLSEQILHHGLENGIELGVCFPVGKAEPVKGTVNGMAYFGFSEDTVHPERYDEKLEPQLAAILDEFEPDIVHIFGTEYPHTLAMTRCVEKKESVLIGIQGICSELAERYCEGLPASVQKRFLFRDFLKRDNIAAQQKKFRLRGAMETKALQNVFHVTGRTAWDHRVTAKMNPKAAYHFLNETLRAGFYEPIWNAENCEKYSIFLSQGNYPIKGLHYLLQAMPEILKQFPKTKVYVAGDKITAYGTFKEKLKIGSYGKYCLDLIKQYGLEESVIFVGRLDEKQMRDRYLKSHLFLSPSSIENSPNSVGEAMLLGMPVISSDVGGVATMLKDKEEGLLYPHNDVKKLSEAVCTMFADEKQAVQFGMRAREHALKTHDPRTNYLRLVEIYKDILNSVFT